MNKKFFFIIPTRGARLSCLGKLLSSMEKQSSYIQGVIIVDSGKEPMTKIIEDFPELNISYLMTAESSSTKQRNLGIKNVPSSADFIGILDDDIIVTDDAISHMLSFFNSAPEDVAGAAFNIVNDRKTRFGLWKQIFLTGSAKPGVVFRSGFRSKICPVDKTIYVRWLFGGATVWRKHIIDKFKFDEWFTGDGFAEDFEHSYRISKNYKLAVVAEAKVIHHSPSISDRNNYQLGIAEIVNRFYCVGKYRGDFSKSLFYWASLGTLLENAIMWMVNLNNGYLKRVLGNISGIIRTISKNGLN